MECASCGQVNNPGLKFCVACGAELSDGVDTTSDSGDSLLPTGTILKLTYEIIRLIGEGGAGAVYEGRHIDLGHPVAIKVLFGQLARMRQIRDRFVEEGRIQANLRHPNIVRVTDIVDDGKLVAIVMEYIHGATLHHLIQRQKGPIELTRAAQILLRLLAGLKAAHDHRIVHRDIKPGNIMLAQTEHGMVPKLCDFGIAKVASSQSRTITGTKMGTLHYMAPEQFQDARRVDLRADIYSLGVTFYELVTGRLPFDTDNDYQLMQSHIEVEPPSPRGVRSDVSAELDAFILKALAKKPDGRYPNCAEMVDALTAIPEFTHLQGVASLPGVPISEDMIPPVSPTPFQPRTKPRSPRQEKPIPTSVERPRPTRTTPRPATRVEQKKKEKPVRIPWFPIALGALAAGVVVLVAVWYVQQDQSTTSAMGAQAITPPSDNKLSGDDSSDDGEGTGTAVVIPVEDAGITPPDDGQLTAVGCEALAIELEVLDDMHTLEADVSQMLLARLEEADACRSLLLTASEDEPFSFVYQQTQADRLLIAKYVLRARHRASSADEACMQILPARRVFDRALTRLQQTLESGELRPFEVETIREIGENLYESRSQLQTRYYQCP